MGILEEKADLLDLLFEATNDGVVDWDLLGNQTRYNDRWRFLLGWDEAGFILTPQTWRELIHVEDRGAVDRGIAEHLEQGWPFAQTVRMRHRSQGWRWVLMRGSARRNERGDPVRMAILFADVDQRVRAESQVRALVEAIPDTILRVRCDGTVLAVKEGNRLENTELEYGNVSHGTFDAILASASGGRLLMLIRSAGERKEVVQLPCRLRNPAGDPTDYDIRIVGSGVDEVVCIVRDVTHEKSVEEQLARGRKLEAIGQLAAGLAHEINTPLQYIGDNLQFAKDAIPPLLDLLDVYHQVVCSGEAVAPDALAAITRKEEEGDLAYVRAALPGALATGLDGLAQIARIVHAMKTFEDVGRQGRTRVELNPIVENTTVVATHAWSHVAEVSLRLDPSLPFVPCVAGEIAQVVLNLVINAAQAISDKVGSSGRKGRITVETCHDAAHDSAEIRVSDDGVGIPEEVRAKVFDPFFTTRAVGQGSGQGLAQVHSAVVQLHGGGVRFESHAGEGTCFIVTLPLQDAEALVSPAIGVEDTGQAPRGAGRYEP